jgi:hypothetical protein
VIILHHFRLTKCTFHKFGASGELEKHDALCILPLNIFNEKIYIFLWFWMLSLTALTSIVVFYRCGLKMRNFDLWKRECYTCSTFYLFTFYLFD